MNFFVKGGHRNIEFYLFQDVNSYEAPALYELTALNK
jgi:hypothetical protein